MIFGEKKKELKRGNEIVQLAVSKWTVTQAPNEIILETLYSISI